MNLWRDGLHSHPGRAEEPGHVVCTFLRDHALIDAGAACAARAAHNPTSDHALSSWFVAASRVDPEV